MYLELIDPIAGLTHPAEPHKIRCARVAELADALDLGLEK